MSIGHAERRHPPCLGAETPAGSCRRSVRVHQPWLSAPRVSLAANLVVRHSTPNSTAPRSHPASPEHARAHGSGEAAATAQCRPARVKPFADLLLRPSHHRTDFQPPCARPWPRRHAPVSNPSIPVEAALHDQANELVQGQIVKIYLAGQGTDCEESRSGGRGIGPKSIFGLDQRLRWSKNQRPRSKNGTARFSARRWGAENPRLRKCAQRARMVQIGIELGEDARVEHA
jgi:hypothetical protein